MTAAELRNIKEFIFEKNANKEDKARLTSLRHVLENSMY
jgi:hypothetical protein